MTRLAVLSVAEAGFKAARLALALRAGLPVLPGFVVPVPEARGVLGEGAGAVLAHGVAAGRVAVLGCAVDPELEAELRGVVDGLGGRVIVRSSSPLEGDPAWSGAFSSVIGVGPEDVARAVRSCWASAFAVDPLRRLDACGLGLEALELAVLLQPEISPKAGGVARVEPGSGADVEVIIEGVRGHPGPLLSGWAEGALARVRDAGTGPGEDDGLTGLIGARTVADVAALAGRVYAELGDDVIEWAVCDGTAWLLQSLRSTPPASPGIPAAVPTTTFTSYNALATPDAVAPLVAADCMGMALAALTQERGIRVPAQPAAPGTATGPLMACRPHETVDCRDAILLVDRPLPALAPLLFGARGVISRAGAAGSHLAQVARSLGVPMVTGCRPEAVTGPDPSGWSATVNGTTGEVTVLAGPGV